MFETHRASDSVEDLVNAAATGDVGKVEQLLEGGACGVDDKFEGKTALQAAAQNGHLDIVHVLTQYNASLEESVSRWRGGGGEGGGEGGGGGGGGGGMGGEGEGTICVVSWNKQVCFIFS